MYYLNAAICSLFTFLAVTSFGQNTNKDNISGSVYRDYNSNGVWDLRDPSSDYSEPGVYNITVKAFDKDNNLVDSTKTDYNGQWNILATTGTNVRIEFTLPDYLIPAKIGSGSSVSRVTFASAPSSNINFGVYNPSDYCEADPEIIAPCFNKDDNTVSPLLISIDYSDGGNSPTDITDYQETNHPVSVTDNAGTIYGLAYNRRNDKIFAARYYKSNHELGTMNSSSTGVILAIDNSTNDGTNASVSDTETSIFMDFGSYTGAEPTGGAPYKSANKFDYPTEWADAFAGVGKIGLGDIDISDDGETLYTINLNTRELYIIPIGSNATAPTVASVVSNAVSMPSPSSCTDEIRPFGLKFQDGLLYIGMVCSGENQTALPSPDFSPDILRGYIYTYDPSTGSISSDPVLDFPLNYDRGIFGYSTDEDDAKAEWNPWIDDWSSSYNPVFTTSSGVVGYAQPIISDIEFDRGDMIITIMDRFGEQTSGMIDPRCNCNDYGQWVLGIPAGDMLRAGYNGDNTWTLEQNSEVTSVLTGKNQTLGFSYQSGPGTLKPDGTFLNPGGEYYFQDSYANHAEVTVGGLAQIPGMGDIIVGAYDVSLNYFLNTGPRWGSGGLMWLNNYSGEWTKAFEAYYGGVSSYNKGNGFGDVEVLCGMAPLEVGNRVWNDTDADGIQDPGEEGIPNVTLHLYRGSTLAATTVTNTEGIFLFNSDNINLNSETELILGETYTIVIDAGHYSGGTFTANGIDYGSIVPTDQTNTTSDNSDIIDSDAAIGTSGPGNTLPSIAFTLNSEGQNTYALDFGFGESASLGNLVWFDADEDGIQDGGSNEPGIPNVKVTLFQENGTFISSTITDAQGAYEFIDLAPGNYYLSFSNLPENYVSTQDSLGGDQSLDSDIDSLGMTTGIIEIAKGDSQIDIDAGFYRSLEKASLGNYVWIDEDGDGIQDSGEDPLSGVKVTLYNNLNDPISSTYTDEDGSYLFRNLDSGAYSVGFEAPNGSTYTLTGMDQGGDDNLDSDANTSTGISTSVTLAAGEENTSLGAGFYKTATVTGYTWIDQNGDGIQDATEDILSNVTVYLYDENDVLQGTNTSDVNGSYTFTNVNPGAYYVQFSEPSGYETTDKLQGTDTESDSDADTVSGQSAVFNIASGETVTGYNAGYFQYATIGDYLFYDSDYNNYQTSSDNNSGTEFFSSVQINLFDKDGNIVTTTTTNSSGNYSFTNVKPGTYTVGVDRSSMMALYPGRGASYQDIDYDYSLSPAVPVTDLYDSDIDFYGWKTDRLEIGSGETNNTIDFGFNWGGTGNSNWLGDYVWEDTDQDGVQDPEESGIANVSVVLFDDNGTFLAHTITDTAGYYMFTRVATSSTYQVAFGPPAGYNATINTADSDIDPNTHMDTITIVAGQNDLDAGFYPTASLGNFVWEDNNGNGIQDSDEKGIPDVSVVLYNAGGSAVDSAFTDAYGNFEIAGITPGTGYYLEFETLSGYTATSADIGGDDTVDSDINTSTKRITSINLNAGDSLFNYAAGFYKTASLGDFVWEDTNGNGVQDSGESGIANVSVSLYDESDSFIGSTTTAVGTGAYSFTNVAPGNYYVVFTNLPVGYVATWKNAGSTQDADNDGGNSNTTDIFSVSTGENKADVDGGFHPGLTLNGFAWEDTDGNGLQNESGTELENVPVTLYDNDGNSISSTTTNSSGIYQFADLSAGDYYVVFGNAPSGEPFTTQYANGNSYFTDSDADASTGRSATFSLTVNNDADRSIDAGYMAALPVELSRFEGWSEDCANILSWETQSEIGHDFFDIQKSKDGINFNSIGLIQGTGDSYENKSYEYKDDIGVGINYYRLRQVDRNGTINYSSVVVINNEFCTQGAINIFPNPSSDEVNIEFESLVEIQNATISLVDPLGRILQRTNTQFQIGSNVIQLNIQNIPPGAYDIQISVGNKWKNSKRFIKIN